MTNAIKVQLYPHLGVVVVLNVVVLGLGLFTASLNTLLLNAGVTSVYFASVAGILLGKGYVRLSESHRDAVEGRNFTLVSIALAAVATLGIFGAVGATHFTETGDGIGVVAVICIALGGGACSIITVMGLCVTLSTSRSRASLRLLLWSLHLTSRRGSWITEDN